MDLSEEWTAIAVRYWKEAGVDQRIDLRLGDAADYFKVKSGSNAFQAGRDGPPGRPRRVQRRN